MNPASTPKCVASRRPVQGGGEVPPQLVSRRGGGCARTTIQRVVACGGAGVWRSVRDYRLGAPIVMAAPPSGGDDDDGARPFGLYEFGDDPFENDTAAPHDSRPNQWLESRSALGGKRN